MCTEIRRALKNKRLYQLKTIAEAAGIEGVSSLPKDKLVDAICDAYSSNEQVRDRMSKRFEPTFWHRHRRLFAKISVVSSILGIIGFFLYFLPRDDSGLMKQIDASTSKALDKKLGPAAPPALEVFFKVSQNEVGHRILQKRNLPLSTGVLIQIHATLSEPAYVYLFHLMEGEPPTLLYPGGWLP